MEELCQRIAPASLPKGLAIRRINLVADGDVAPFGQLYRDVPLDRCYDELYEGADLEARCAAMEAFNATSRWKKRGLAVVPTVRHVSLGKAWDNQGLCLLNLYTDGTVLVHTGGIEVGQGLHTKIAQVLFLPPSLEVCSSLIYSPVLISKIVRSGRGSGAQGRYG